MEDKSRYFLVKKKAVPEVLLKVVEAKRLLESERAITVQEAAIKWGITPRQVQILCKTNRIDGATRISRIWIIPENAEKPTNNKRKAAYSHD